MRVCLTPGVSTTGDWFIIETESGVWCQDYMQSMQSDGEIVWYHIGHMHGVSFGLDDHNGPYPRWLQYFLNKYLWMLNDPMSWEHHPTYKEVHVPYKWPESEMRRYSI